MCEESYTVGPQLYQSTCIPLVGTNSSYANELGTTLPRMQLTLDRVRELYTLSAGVSTSLVGLIHDEDEPLDSGVRDMARRVGIQLWAGWSAVLIASVLVVRESKEGVSVPIAARGKSIQRCSRGKGRCKSCSESSRPDLGPKFSEPSEQQNRLASFHSACAYLTPCQRFDQCPTRSFAFRPWLDTEDAAMHSL